MIRYLSTGAADLARLLAQSHATQPSPIWAEAQSFFGFDTSERPEAQALASTALWGETGEGMAR
ncbi:hypothetical protein [Asaia krungthepensis]|uniref:Uncharacterized protein n=1 Tax=Asaia krungthepensis NRIC 0535 TaxID=1307925 RepID=A0ABQ0Q441_9PROT|nr:hypothetical protein [Asaia krungthepensis]GBQ90493.1 hypothetical protein AA0535_2060 [Asaia krungthepensis NRIC 0535]